jgi:hypothetical protein
MARSSAQISAALMNYLQTTYGQVNQPFYNYFNDINGNPITPSNTAFLTMVIDVVSWGDNLFEQLLDQYQLDVEAAIAAGVPETSDWIKQQVLNFQYSATTPQILQFTNLVPAYPSILPALRIVTQCAITTDPTIPAAYVVKCKASGSVLTTPQITALSSYLDILMPPGLHFAILTAPDDFIMIGATIYYDGQYALTSVQTNVQNAITTYLSSLPFNGVVDLSDLMVLIKSVSGVKDITWSQVEARAYNVVVGSATKLVNASTMLQRNYATYSGSVIPDTATGRDLASTLVYSIATS